MHNENIRHSLAYDAYWYKIVNNNLIRNNYVNFKKGYIKNPIKFQVFNTQFNNAKLNNLQ